MEHDRRLQQTITTYENIHHLYSSTFSHVSEHIDDFVELVKPQGRVLDVGCGPGVDAEFFYSKGFEVTGLDYCQKMIHFAKKRNPLVHFIHGDMRKVDFPWNYFDGIFASYSLIHVPQKDIFATLSRFFNYLKPNGIFYCSLQEGESQEVFVPTPLKLDERIFLNIISCLDIRKLLTSVGFNLLKEFQRKPHEGRELNFTKFAVLATKPSKEIVEEVLQEKLESE